MLQYKIEKIFPTPLYSSKLDRSLSAKEMACANQCLKLMRQNQGNSFSDNMQVLDLADFVDLRTWLELNLSTYLEQVYRAKPGLELVITQSWINLTTENQHHHQHQHPNSVVSGVFYLQTTGPDDGIKFERDHRPWLVDNLAVTDFNIEQLQLMVKPGQLVLFPSNLTHSVPRNQTKFNRVSLSFNTMFNGWVNQSAGCALQIQ